ncbi:hypothetical protein JOC77_002977 [Peribacillus deserti]|uniref:site-specific DNA-methyltransferase (adenine-specific) n=1 Tax=Peribacillus deserti TaxID=673318 RepID=A0ABS2QKA5_9BACI|nr:N-6 DNA methylase [Peribacillus deserti]MBM7693537.1 hypothetical protein [Peribacillus deserti]
MSERLTESIVYDFFRKHKGLSSGQSVTIYPQPQYNEIEKIKKLLKNASKKGNGDGKPEFIVTFPSPNSDLLIVVECKKDILKHQSKTGDQYGEYAVDGVLLYSSFLSKEYDVLSIAVSGITEEQLNVSHFLQLKGQPKAKALSTAELLTFNDYLRLYLYDEDKEKQSYEQLLDYSRKLNEHLRDIDLSESQRPLLVSGILMALEDAAFVASYKKKTVPSTLSKFLVTTISEKLDENKISGFAKNTMIQSYGFINTHSVLASDKLINIPSQTEEIISEDAIKGNYNTVLRDLIEDIEKNVKGFTRTYKYYDVLGKFYAEFLRYANGDKSLGIVLTPQHITELFVDIANVNENSIIYDNCTGTAGFPISAMKRMIELCQGNSAKEEQVYRNLIGAEANSNMFTLAVSNLLIRGVKTINIHYGSCFELAEDIKLLKPNVGFLNPPYAKKKEDARELKFVLNNLEVLQPLSTCIAIVPISCAINDPLKKELLKKHTLEAVFSMPEELFYDSKASTVTCIMVFTAHKPHEQSNKKTFFGYWRNDGFVKNKKYGRVDSEKQWQEIKSSWVSSFRDREPVEGQSLLKRVTAEDEWTAEAYLNTDYSTLTELEFEETLKSFLLFSLKDIS